jgi:predicted Ser/Thr protein kinase
VIDPADIVAAKLMHQLGWASPEELQLLLVELHADPLPVEFLSELQARSVVSAEQASYVRGCTARFQVAFFEAAYMRELERRGMESNETVDLLARAESTGHVVRLSYLLHERGQIPDATLWEIQELTLRNVRSQDAKVIERYARQDFVGVARPLVPDGQITDDTFRVSRLFRSRSTQVNVLQVIAQHQIQDRGDTAAIEVDSLNATKEHVVDIDLAPFRLRGEKQSGESFEREFIGDYRVLQCLGTGGMGAVYLAEIGVGQIVAVKILLASRAGPDDVARFEREAQISGLIDHPGVVRLLDSGRTEDGLLYMVIPPYPSTSLRTLLKRDEVTLELAFKILEELFDALAAVHDAGVVHRDVKPENLLLLVGSDQVKLVDFGIARFYEGPTLDSVYRTNRGVITGSPAYLAPETIVGEACEPRTDLYACGILAYELLTGEPPFAGETAIEFAEQHMYSVPPSLSDSRPELYWCPELEMLIANLLAKQPKDRPPSAAAVRDLLRGGLSARSLQLLIGSAGETDLHGSFET